MAQDAPLHKGETPGKFIINRGFMVDEEFFDNETFKLPLILKKLASDTCESHKEKLERFFLVCDDATFTKVGGLIDPEKQTHEEFFKLYNACCNVRVEKMQIRKEQAPEEPQTQGWSCSIFWASWLASEADFLVSRVPIRKSSND